MSKLNYPAGTPCECTPLLRWRPVLLAARPGFTRDNPRCGMTVTRWKVGGAAPLERGNRRQASRPRPAAPCRHLPAASTGDAPPGVPCAMEAPGKGCSSSSGSQGSASAAACWRCRSQPWALGASNGSSRWRHRHSTRPLEWVRRVAAGHPGRLCQRPASTAAFLCQSGRIFGPRCVAPQMCAATKA
jgi:hypothetical protein